MAKAQKKPGLPGKTDSQPKEAPRPNKPPDNAATVQIGPGSRVVGGLPGVVVEDAVDIFKTVIQRGDNCIYFFDGVLGSGAAGTVYLCREVNSMDDKDWGRPVAIKLIDLSGLDGKVAAKRTGQFLTEIGLLYNLKHPNIVGIMGCGKHQGMPYCIMEYLKGDTLRQEIHKKVRLPWHEAAPIILKICSGLAAAHKQGIAHLDLKPENIFLEEVEEEDDKLVKILDFGVAKIRHKKHDYEQEGVADGTPTYMSPEQISAEEEVDHRSDIYSMGVVMYEMLCGRPPFDCKNPNNRYELIGFVMKLKHDKPQRLDEMPIGVPKEVADIVAQCLEKDPEKRPGSIKEVRDALAAALAENGHAVNGVPPNGAPGETETMEVHIPKATKPPKKMSYFAKAALILGTAVTIAGAAVGLAVWSVSDRGPAQLPAGNDIPAMTTTKPGERDQANPSTKPAPSPNTVPSRLDRQPALIEPITKTDTTGPEPPPEKVVHNITIKTNVVGASIYAGETKVGVTGPDKALTFQLEESIEEMQLAVKMRGRSTVYLRITPEGDLVRSVRLRERETPSRPRPGKTPSKRPMSDYALPD